MVVNHNGADFLLECLHSLRHQTAPPRTVVVVDNASTDGSIGQLHSCTPAVQLLSLASNLGFGAAVNRALAQTSEPWIALLNPDATADPDFLAALWAAGQQSPRIGMVAAKILNYQRRDQLDSAGLAIYPDGLARGRGRLQSDRGQFDRLEPVFCPSGCAALLRRAMLDEIGGFDESFFLYGEDTDLGYRARLCDWECLYQPRAVAYHRYSSSVGAYAALKAHLAERNRRTIAVQYFPWGRLLLASWHTAVRVGLQAFGALRGRGAAARLRDQRSMAALAAAFLRARWDNLCRLPRTLEQRRRWTPRRRRARHLFSRWQRDFGISARELTLTD
ncbi:MAG TPA: glycosyltransferase family 2 protein [Acidobacteriota bacterium]